MCYTIRLYCVIRKKNVSTLRDEHSIYFIRIILIYPSDVIFLVVNWQCLINNKVPIITSLISRYIAAFASCILYCCFCSTDNNAPVHVQHIYMLKTAHVLEKGAVQEIDAYAVLMQTCRTIA